MYLLFNCFNSEFYIILGFFRLFVKIKIFKFIFNDHFNLILNYNKIALNILINIFNFFLIKYTLSF